MDTFTQMFYWASCSVCKGTETLQVCGGCQLIYYCSKSHQKMHWPFHKELCKSVRAVVTSEGIHGGLFSNAYETTCGASATDWKNYRLRSILFTELIMFRKLIPVEKQMFLYPRVCEVCKTDSSVELKNCEYCLCVCYCSTVHQEGDINHADKCSSLKTCRELDLSMEDTSYLSYLDKFPSLNMEENGIPQNMDELLTKFPTASETCNMYKEKLLCSELLTCPMTLVYTLEQRRKVYPFKDIITVHIVGASELECGYPKVWSIVLNAWSLGPRLRIEFIGPEVLYDEDEMASDIGLEKESNIILKCFNGLYQDYQDSETFTCPDIIMAYNCGFQEYLDSPIDRWRDTLPYFFKVPGVHITITSYTKTEAIKDLSVLLTHSNENAKIFLQCFDNPFCSKRPHREWEELRSDIFFANKYMSIVQVN